MQEKRAQGFINGKNDVTMFDIDHDGLHCLSTFKRVDGAAGAA